MSTPKCKYKEDGMCMHKFMCKSLEHDECIYTQEDVVLCPCYETAGVTIEHYKKYLEANKRGMVCLSDKVRVSNATILKWIEDEGGRVLCR